MAFPLLCELLYWMILGFFSFSHSKQQKILDPFSTIRINFFCSVSIIVLFLPFPLFTKVMMRLLKLCICRVSFTRAIVCWSFQNRAFQQEASQLEGQQKSFFFGTTSRTDFNYNSNINSKCLRRKCKQFAEFIASWCQAIFLVLTYKLELYFFTTTNSWRRSFILSEVCSKIQWTSGVCWKKACSNIGSKQASPVAASEA